MREEAGEAGFGEGCSTGARNGHEWVWGGVGCGSVWFGGLVFALATVYVCGLGCVVVGEWAGQGIGGHGWVPSVCRREWVGVGKRAVAERLSGGGAGRCGRGGVGSTEGQLDGEGVGCSGGCVHSGATRWCGGGCVRQPTGLVCRRRGEDGGVESKMWGTGRVG